MANELTLVLLLLFILMFQLAPRSFDSSQTEVLGSVMICLLLLSFLLNAGAILIQCLSTLLRLCKGKGKRKGSKYQVNPISNLILH